MSFSNSFARQTINFVKLICLSLSRSLKPYFYISRRFWKSCWTDKNRRDLPSSENRAEDSLNSTLLDRKCILDRNNFGVR